MKRGGIATTRGVHEAFGKSPHAAERRSVGRRMSIQDLGSIGEFVAALATILTLVYLAMQIRRNTSVARASATQDVLNSHRLLIRELLTLNPKVDDIFVRGIHSFTSLDRGEQRRFHYTMSEFMLHAQNALQLQQKGVLDNSDADVWMGFALQILRMPGSAQWWVTQRRIMDPAFCAEVDERLQKPGESLTDVLPHFILEDGA